MDVHSELRQAQLEVDSAGLAPEANKVGRILFKDATEPMQINDSTQIHKVLTDKIYNEFKNGISNVSISGSSGAFSTTSTSFVDVTNLSVDITTSGGAVDISLIPGSVTPTESLTVGAFRSGESVTGYLVLLRDGAAIAEFPIGVLSLSGSITSISLPGSSIRTTDFPTAGTYTYKLQAKGFGGTQVNVSYAKLMAREVI